MQKLLLVYYYTYNYLLKHGDGNGFQDSLQWKGCWFEQAGRSKHKLIKLVLSVFIFISVCLFVFRFCVILHACCHIYKLTTRVTQGCRWYNFQTDPLTSKPNIPKTKCTTRNYQFGSRVNFSFHFLEVGLRGKIGELIKPIKPNETNWNCSKVLAKASHVTSQKTQSSTLQYKINIDRNTTGVTGESNLPYIMQTPVSCRKRKRLTLNNHTVKTVIINKNIITNRNAVSIALYFFSFSAASFSLALSASSIWVSAIAKGKTRRNQKLTNSFLSAAILMQGARWQDSIQAPWVNLSPKDRRICLRGEGIWLVITLLCSLSFAIFACLLATPSISTVVLSKMMLK